MEEVGTKLEEIDRYISGPEYPFILENISDFYDRIQEISNSSQTMNNLLKDINECNKEITDMQTKLGNSQSDSDFELLVETTENKISEYKTLEENVVKMTNALYDDVLSCVEDLDTKDYVIPLSIKEAELLLNEQNTVIQELHNESDMYKRRCEEIEKRIARIQKKKELNGIQINNATSKQTEATREKFVNLYHLKRIINHSVGINDLEANDSVVKILFKNDAQLTIQIDSEQNTIDASLINPSQGSMLFEFMHVDSEFEELKKRCVGKYWSILAKEVLYLLYSERRLKDEIGKITCKHCVNLSSDNRIQIVFSNLVVIELTLPSHYPRTVEKLIINSISTSDVDQSIVNNLKGTLHNKQFFSLGEFVEFVEQTMEEDSSYHY